MEDYNTTLTELEEMKSRFDVGFSSLDRSKLDALYYAMFGKEITNKGCSDCYRDAYILITNKLRKDKSMPNKSDYKLKPGVVIQFFGEPNFYTNPNLTNEVAERYLALNTDNAKLFETLPDDWKDRVADYSKTDSEEVADNAEQAKIEELNQKIETLEKLLAEKTESEDNPSDTALELENLQSELAIANDSLEKTQAEVEKLQAENATLAKENRALKAANTRLKNKEAQAETEVTETETEVEDAAPETE
jgi:uncharacterized phage infection (PIP) family protein YhgE